MFWRSDCCYRCSRRRARRSFFRGIIAALLLIMAGAVLLHERTSPARPSSSHTRPARPHPSDTRARAISRAALISAGQGLTWTGFRGIALPTSASAGPRDTRGGLASGFTDTPRGALLAAINIAVRTAAQWGPPIFKPTITRQVTGPDAQALLHADALAYNQLRAAAHARAGQPIGRAHAAEVAWRFVAYTPAAATIDVVTAGRGTNGARVLTVTRIEVIWQRGDWRVTAPPGGDWANSATAISSLTGYSIFPRNTR